MAMYAIRCIYSSILSLKIEIKIFSNAQKVSISLIKAHYTKITILSCTYHRRSTSVSELFPYARIFEFALEKFDP